MGIAGDLEDITADTIVRLPRGWDTVLDGHWLGLSGDTYIRLMAARWNLAADLYLDHFRDMILVKYEDFLADKVGAVAQLVHELNLMQRNEIAAEVDIQYQPHGNRGISWKDFFGVENLKRIEQVCGNRMRQLGYSTCSELTSG
jgi:hypothetical protein